MQIVYLSARPEVFSATLMVSARLMPFLSKALVVVPERMVDKFKSVQTRLDLVVLTDEEITGCSRGELHQLDHSALNYRLRSDLVFRPEIESEFIMSDDDYRPLCEIPVTTFVENNRHNAYYFYDLPLWKFGDNPFDHCQRNSMSVLQSLELPVLAYASHMPQVINKVHFQESIKAVRAATDKLGLCCLLYTSPSPRDA